MCTQTEVRKISRGARVGWVPGMRGRSDGEIEFVWGVEVDEAILKADNCSTRRGARGIYCTVYRLVRARRATSNGGRESGFVLGKCRVARTRNVVQSSSSFVAQPPGEWR
jgi:hypothetical protein